MVAVTTVAIGHPFRTVLQGQPVVTVEIVFYFAARDVVFFGDDDRIMTTGAGIEGYVVERDRGTLVGNAKDGVFAVTIGADGGVFVSRCDRDAVLTFHELFFFGGMALTAGLSHIEEIGFGFGVVERKNSMKSVTLNAGWRFFVAGHQLGGVNALSIERLDFRSGRIISFQDVACRMTLPAGVVDVEQINGGSQVVGRKDGVRIAVTHVTGRPSLDPMNGRFQFVRHILMARGTIHRL